MFLIMLRFSNNKSAAAEHMQAHNAWIAKGFEDGVFLLTGSVEPKQGGAVLAYNIAGDELEKRVAEDPFVASDVVTAQIIEITPGRTDPRLDFLRG
ncbi:YciI family protein [Hoeflea alexandrii]